MEKLSLYFFIYDKRTNKKLIRAQVITGGATEEGYGEIYKYTAEHFGPKDQYGFHVYDQKNIDGLTPVGVTIIEDLR